MNPSALEREVLSLGAEDWYALWAILGLRSDVFPSGDDEEKRRLARSTLRKMVQEDLLYLCFFKHTGSREVRIARDQVDEIIDDATNWEPTPGDMWHVRFAATEKGERVYSELPPWT